jgi:hypothetical protein
MGKNDHLWNKKGKFIMRITDHRYTGEMAKFELAVRMIGHEARTGTIRRCTGFTEDRIRKIYGTYFKPAGSLAVKRRRGKSPTQISHFVSSAQKQFESTVLACLFVFTRVLQLDDSHNPERIPGMDGVELGQKMCDAFAAYANLFPDSRLSYERAWGLFNALAVTRELCFADCSHCHGVYIQDAYALNYRHCPFCELKDQPADKVDC